MTTAAVLVDQALGRLRAGTREQINVLTTAIDTDDTSLEFDHALRGIQEGAVLDLDTEQVYVVGSTAGAHATVIRAYGGTTAASHVAGTQVIVNPKWPRASLFDALADEIDALAGDGLYQVKTVTLTYIPSRQGYDLTGVTAADDIYAMYAEQSGPETDWPRIPRTNYTFRRHQDTTDFPSGLGLVLHYPEYAQSGFPLRVLYKAPFTRPATIATDINTTSGVPSSANDLVVLGTQIRLIPGREVARNTFESQGEPRRAEEVPPGSQVQAVRALELLRARRLGGELALLARRYPDWDDR